MRTLVRLLLILCSFPILLLPQSNAIPFYSRYDFQFAAPGATSYGLYGSDNPAGLAALHGVDLSLMVSDNTKRSLSDHWGMYLGAPDAAFGMEQERTPAGIRTRYHTALAFGDRSLSGGLAYQWTVAGNAVPDRVNAVSVGALVRPSPMLSVGAVWSQVTNGDGWNAAADVSIRPFGSELLTLFGEMVLQRMPLLSNEVWSAGVVIEPLSGARFSGRYFENGAVNIGVQLNLGHVGVASTTHLGKTSAAAYRTHGLRIGVYDGHLLRSVASKGSKFVPLELPGGISYQRYELFDNSTTLTSLLAALEAVKNDPEVAGIALNTATLSANREMLWEVREKLKECRQAGKRIIIFIERGGIDLLHFASVGDRIVMDPTGMLVAEGYLMGRTYLKGTLEKLGIGFDEWRFLTYKSANETFSMDRMTDADREQRQAIVDDWYDIARREISASRSIPPERFDSLVNSSVMLMPEAARAAGLVDSIGRWETVKEIVKAETGSEKGWISAAAVWKQANYRRTVRWGEPPKIAVIYALGVCAMDEGINARSLVKDVEAAVENSDVKAIVLRVDSPGGDAMASDYIAEALKKAKGKKPVIISQGYVAASGGYWLSMYGDTIVAAPGTITGSIGVIGGWFYNKGLKESLGMATDFVKAGAHADLGFGFQLPLIGLGVPDRNLSLEERSTVEKMIRGMYAEFVGKVAAGRGMSRDAVESVAQGRVWSGIDGKEKGLVDELGGLETAIAIAREKAGFTPDDAVKIVEIPKKGLFDAGAFVPRLFGVSAPPPSDRTVDMVKFRLQNNGAPLPLVPLDDADLWKHTGY